jgi:hypothetical protein
MICAISPVENKPASAIARAASPFERSGMRAKIPSSFSLLASRFSLLASRPNTCRRHPAVNSFSAWKSEIFRDEKFV